MVGDDMKSIGERIKDIREEQGFPQKQVSDILGIQRPNYSKIEHDKQNLTPRQLKLLCEFFDVSADYILDITVKNKKAISKFDQDDILHSLEVIKQKIR